MYEQAGIEHNWLDDGRYETAVDTDGKAAPAAPVSVRFDVAALFRPPAVTPSGSG